MSTIATAYVQVLPSTKGIKSELTSAFGDAGTDAGASMGSNLTSSLMKVLKVGSMATIGVTIGKKIVGGISASVQEGGNLEQSIGGIQTLFKKSANLVMKNASNAWKTAGISANEYMEQTTSFGASLIKSLGGDTKKAAKIADTAITDMSDNSNKFGTNIESIQNAYQGFAKQNFTMLDNLKLGYGGTKEEMEKLLQDASKISGIKFKIDSFADIIQAIHTVQEELGVTGTTAKEAAETLSGSFASAKAALKDVLGGMALGGDVSKQLDNLGEAFSTFFNDNLLPMIENVVSSLPDVFSKIIEGLTSDGMSDTVGKIAQIGVKLAKGLVSGLGELAAAAPLIIMKLAEGLISAAPELAKAIPDMMRGLAEGIVKYAPEIAKEIPKLVMAMAQALVESSYYLLEGLAELMVDLISQVPSYCSDMAAAFKSWGPTIAQSFQTWGSDISAAIAPAISGLKDTFGPAISSIASSLGPLASSFQNMFSQIGSFASACANLVVTVFQPIGQRIGALFQSAVSVIQSAFAPIGSFMQQVADRIVAGIRSAVQKFRAIGQQMMKQLLEGITSAAQGIVDYIKGIVDKIANMFESLTNKVNNVTKSISDKTSKTKSTVQNATSSASYSSMSVMSAAPISSYSAFNTGLTRDSATPVQVNVTLSGSAKNIFDSVQVENTKLVTSTGYHALA